MFTIPRWISNWNYIHCYWHRNFKFSHSCIGTFDPPCWKHSTLSQSRWYLAHPPPLPPLTRSLSASKPPVAKSLNSWQHFVARGSWLDLSSNGRVFSKPPRVVLYWSRMLPPWNHSKYVFAPIVDSQRAWGGFQLIVGKVSSSRHLLIGSSFVKLSEQRLIWS